MQHRKRIILALIVTVAVAILPALALVIYVDPFQIYHKSFISGMGLQENQRYQNAGLINSYLNDPAEGYDSVMIGTSMSQNFTSALAEQTLGWKKSLRLFMPGAVAEEQIAVLQHALNTGRVQHVLLELHPFLYQDSYRQKKQVAEDPTLYFPEFLYNNNFFDDAPYIFNIDVLKMSWRILGGKLTDAVLKPESIGYWGNKNTLVADYEKFNTPASIAKLRELTAGFQLHARSERDVDSQKYPILTDNLFPLLKKYCNTDKEIILFIPPWPRFRYQKSEKVTLRSIYMLRSILSSTENCKNIRLYDFDTMNFSGDMKNYMDEQHYMPWINADILTMIASQQGRLTTGNIAEFENRMIAVLNNYQIYTTLTTAAPSH